MRRDQTAAVRAALEQGVLCGRWAYFNALPNARTRAGELAERMGMELVSELCRHREPGDPAYHDYVLMAREPKQLAMAI